MWGGNRQKNNWDWKTRQDKWTNNRVEIAQRHVTLYVEGVEGRLLCVFLTWQRGERARERREGRGNSDEPGGIYSPYNLSTEITAFFPLASLVSGLGVAVCVFAWFLLGIDHWVQFPLIWAACPVAEPDRSVCNARIWRRLDTDGCLLDFCVHLYAPTDHRELPSNQAAELRRTGPGVEVQILPHHTGEGGWDMTRDMIFMRLSTINKATQVTISALKDKKHPPPSPPLAAGPDEVPQVCELGSAPGGQAGSGAAGEVEADGCGGLTGAAVLPVHQPDGQTLRCGAPAAGRWWGRRRKICVWAEKFLVSHSKVDPNPSTKENYLETTL